MNSTETPGGSGIPAGWYDDPSGGGLRWWDGEQWTEHVHTAESAAVASAEPAAEREAPPPELVGLRESIRRRGAKGVGIVLGIIVIVIIVIALLLSGGSDNNSGSSGNAGGANAAKQAEIKSINAQLKDKDLPKAERKALEEQKKALQGGGKSGKSGKQDSGNGKSQKKHKAPGEEGN